MNDDYVLLPRLSVLLKVLAVLAIAVGLYYVLYGGIIEPSMRGHRFGTGDKIDLIIGYLMLLIGLLGYVAGEIADVVLAIASSLKERVVSSQDMMLRQLSDMADAVSSKT